MSIVKITTPKANKAKYWLGEKNNEWKSGELCFCLTATTKYLVSLPFLGVSSLICKIQRLN